MEKDMKIIKRKNERTSDAKKMTKKKKNQVSYRQST